MTTPISCSVTPPTTEMFEKLTVENKEKKLESISLTPPTSENLRYEKLTTENGQKLLESTFFAPNPDGYKEQYTVQLYGKGDQGNIESITKKVQLWGPRAETEKVEKCWVVQNKDSEELGYVNVGKSTLKIANRILYEFGSLFKDSVSKEQQREAIRAVLVNYMVANECSLESSALVGTQSTIDYVKTTATEDFCQKNGITDPEKIEAVRKKLTDCQVAKEESLLAAGLTKLALPPTDDFAKSLEEAIQKDSNRFVIKDNQIEDDGRPVSVFYYHFATSMKC